MKMHTVISLIIYCKLEIFFRTQTESIFDTGKIKVLLKDNVNQVFSIQRLSPLSLLF